jgi:hypothetical protein
MMPTHRLVFAWLHRTIHRSSAGHALALCLILATAFIPVVAQAQTHHRQAAPLHVAQAPPPPNPQGFTRLLHTAWSASYQDTCASILGPHCDGQDKFYTGQIGQLGYLYPFQIPGLVPLYRHREPGRDTCVARVPRCTDSNITPQDARHIIGYLSNRPGPGLVPLYSAWSPQRQDTCLSLRPACNGQYALYTHRQQTLGYLRPATPPPGALPVGVTAVEQRCFDAVQGKVAWNQAGATSWSPASIRKLCQGTPDPARTIACFQAQIRAHNDWNRGITACQPAALAAAPPPAPQPAPPTATSAEQRCFDAVQGKVAWNQAGATRWSPASVRKLCQGTPDPARTIACFQAQIRTHNDWNRGITACRPAALAAAPPKPVPPKPAPPAKPTATRLTAPRPIPPATPVGPAPPASRFDVILYSSWSPSWQDTCASAGTLKCAGQDARYIRHDQLGYLAARPGPGLVPLYLHRNRQAKDTCVSRWPRCGDPKIKPNDARHIIGYVSYAPGPGLVPLYTAWSASRSDTCVSLRPDCNGLTTLYQKHRYLLGYLRAMATPVTPQAQRPPTGGRKLHYANKPGFQPEVVADPAFAWQAHKLLPGDPLAGQHGRTPEGRLARAFGMPAVAYPLIVEAVKHGFRDVTGRWPKPRELNAEIQTLHRVPGARLALAPFLLAEATRAIKATRPTPAQDAFYTAFRALVGIQQYESTRRLRDEWIDYRRRRGGPQDGLTPLPPQSTTGNVDAPKVNATLSVVLDQGPSLSEFRPSQYMLSLGPQGRDVITLITEPLFVLEDAPDLATADDKWLARVIADPLGVPAAFAFGDAIIGAFGHNLADGFGGETAKKLAAKLRLVAKARSVSGIAEKVGSKFSRKLAASVAAKLSARIGTRVAAKLAGAAGAILGGVLPGLVELIIGVVDIEETRAFDAKIMEFQPNYWPDVRGAMQKVPVEEHWIRATLTYELKMMFGDPADRGYLLTAN